jgi:hypothetical protein
MKCRRIASLRQAAAKTDGILIVVSDFDFDSMESYRFKIRLPSREVTIGGRYGRGGLGKGIKMRTI